MNNIFVYGTLMSNHHNHFLISRDNKSRYLGQTKTKESYWFCVRGIPFMVNSAYLVNNTNDNNEAPVIGEVWSVTDKVLSSMDRLEGHPYGYRREQLNVDEFGDVEGYFYQHKIFGCHPNQHGEHQYVPFP